MNREQALAEARKAARSAEGLARKAESSTTTYDHRDKAPVYAAAGAVWADIARAYAAIADATDKPIVVFVDEAQLYMSGELRTGKAALLTELLRAGHKPGVVGGENADA